MYLVTANEMQRMDKKTIQSFGLPGRLLMENAGRGATEIFLKTFGYAAGHQPGARAHGRHGGHGRRAGFPRRSGKDQQVAGMAFVGVRRPGFQAAVDILACQQGLQGPDLCGNMGRDADIDDFKLSGVFSAGVQQMAEFGKAEGGRRVCANACPAGLSRVGIQPGGNIHRQNRFAEAVDRIDNRFEVAFDL